MDFEPISYRVMGEPEGSFFLSRYILRYFNRHIPYILRGAKYIICTQDIYQAFRENNWTSLTPDLERSFSKGGAKLEVQHRRYLNIPDDLVRIREVDGVSCTVEISVPDRAIPQSIVDAAEKIISQIREMIAHQDELKLLCAHFTKQQDIRQACVKSIFQAAGIKEPSIYLDSAFNLNLKVSCLNLKKSIDIYESMSIDDIKAKAEKLVQDINVLTNLKYISLDKSGKNKKHLERVHANLS